MRCHRRLEPEEYLSRKALAKQSRPLIPADSAKSTTEGGSYQTHGCNEPDIFTLENASVGSADSEDIVGDVKVSLHIIALYSTVYPHLNY